MKRYPVGKGANETLSESAAQKASDRSSDSAADHVDSRSVDGGSKVKPQAISDGAVTELHDDALGFSEYVHALVRFLSAEETRAPLAIGITARWGQGKTSFMRMLDSALKTHHYGSTRFASSWFNPWLYNEKEQVWNAFLSNITGCIKQALPFRRRLQFHLFRFWQNLRIRVGFGLNFWIRFITLLVMCLLFLSAIFSEVGGTVLLDLAQRYIGEQTYQALQVPPDSTSFARYLPDLFRWFGAILLASIFYFRVIKKFDLGLIEYLQQKDFTAKAGALAQFQHEMQLLTNAIPDQLRVVVFIDDLDRCEKDILLEVISSLQALTVSSKCYFILGLDLAIVARQLEDTVLAQALEQTDEHQHQFQHGSGFRFLEKVIQARLSVPPYGIAEIGAMVDRLLPEAKPIQPVKSAQSVRERLFRRAGGMIGINEKVAEVVDDPAIGAALRHYGPRYFRNPRSLKRFMNSFRLHAHLASQVDNGVSSDLLARYFVLAESWPGLLDFFQRNPQLLDGWLADPSETENLWMKSTTQSQEQAVLQVLNAPDNGAGALFREGQIMGGDLVVRLCNWYGFRFYRANRNGG